MTLQKNDTPHSAYLKTAFLQLSFAIKLWHYVESHPFDKETFDASLTIQNTIEDATDRVCMPHNEFQSPADLQVAVENNISICFGAAAITLWEAVREKGVYSSKNLPDPLVTERQRLAGLIYMIRCCFAHGTAAPNWEMKPKYKIVYSVGRKQIDLRMLHGKPFTYDSIGGYETLWLLRDLAKSSGII